MFSGLLQKFVWANDWERRESFSKFVKMQVVWPFLATFHFASHAHILMCFDPYEIENVKQKNSSKCSYLICCRGQVQRPFLSDSLAVRRILVLLMTSNELRQLGQSIVNGRTAQQQPFLQNDRHLSILWHLTKRFSCLRVLLSWQYTKRFLSLHTYVAAINVARVLYSPRHAMQIIGMNILLGGRGRAKIYPDSF